MDGLYLGAHYANDGIYIVDHQVQHHRDISTPGIEFRQSMCLYEHRVVDLVPYRHKGRIKTFHMTYLPLYFVFFFKRQLFVGLFQGMGDGLLYKYVFPLFHGPFGTFKMG